MASGQGSVSEGPSPSKSAFRKDPKSHVSQKDISKSRRMLCPNGFGKSKVKSHFLEDSLEPFESNEPWEIPTM